MEELLFEEYIKPDVEHKKDAEEVKTWTVKQVSRGRFEIKNNICRVKILLNGEMKTVFISNSIKTKEFCDIAYKISNSEASLEFFHRKIDWENRPLITFLREYQEKYYKSGSEFETGYWFKLYSETKINNTRREAYQVGWIDYRKQLEKGAIIYDETGLCGLFAMPYNMLFDSLNEECKVHYGDKLFVLKTIKKCKYLMDEKEIIGDRFEVIESYDLNAINDIGRLCKYLTDLEKNSFNKEITELRESLINLEKKYNYSLEEQKNLKKEIESNIFRRIMVFGVGIIAGICICQLI